MAGAAGAGASSSRWYRPVPGFHPHQPAFKHRWGAKLLGATMWFWIFYRAKQDGAVLLVSLDPRTECTRVLETQPDMLSPYRRSWAVSMHLYSERHPPSHAQTCSRSRPTLSTRHASDLLPAPFLLYRDSNTPGTAITLMTTMTTTTDPSSTF